MVRIKHARLLKKTDNAIRVRVSENEEDHGWDDRVKRDLRNVEERDKKWREN